MLLYGLSAPGLADSLEEFANDANIKPENVSQMITLLIAVGVFILCALIAFIVVLFRVQCLRCCGFKQRKKPIRKDHVDNKTGVVTGQLVPAKNRGCVKVEPVSSKITPELKMEMERRSAVLQNAGSQFWRSQVESLLNQRKSEYRQSQLSMGHGSAFAAAAATVASSVDSSPLSSGSVRRDAQKILHGNPAYKRGTKQIVPLVKTAGDTGSNIKFLSRTSNQHRQMARQGLQQKSDFTNQDYQVLNFVDPIYSSPGEVTTFGQSPSSVLGKTSVTGSPSTASRRQNLNRVIHSRHSAGSKV